jgi:DNA-binding response OmpR family regulator
MGYKDKPMPPTSPKPKTPPVVLVVDDDHEQVDILAYFLSRQGMVVLSAYNGRQCLEMVRRRRRRTIDVIILDLIMPGMDGFAVCVALKKMVSARSIPIVLLTARDDMETRQRAMQLGVSEVVAKPARIRDLLARIQVQLEVSRKTRKRKRAPAGKKPQK